MKQNINKKLYAMMEEWLAAWNRGDAEGVASHYADNFDYRDPNVPAGISDKNIFIKYLQKVFELWPEQEWIVDTIMPHEDGKSFSATYSFKFANADKVVKGTGMDRIEFKGGKVSLNHVYLNAENWKEWIQTV